MARIRTLKPEILEDEKTAGLSLAGFKLFAGCILLADDHGNLRGSPQLLRAQIFWANSISPKDVEAAVGELVAAELIECYQVKGQRYLSVTNWAKHQRIDNAGKNRVPPPAEADSEQQESEAEGNGESPRLAEEKRENPLLPPTSDQRTPTKGPPGPGKRLPLRDFVLAWNRGVIAASSDLGQPANVGQGRLTGWPLRLKQRAKEYPDPEQWHWCAYALATSWEATKAEAFDGYGFAWVCNLSKARLDARMEKGIEAALKGRQKVQAPSRRSSEAHEAWTEVQGAIVAAGQRQRVEVSDVARRGLKAIGGLSRLTEARETELPKLRGEFLAALGGRA